MQNLVDSWPITFPGLSAGQYAAAVAPGPCGCDHAYRPEQQFVQMLNAFRPSGGLARSDEVLTLCESRSGPGVARLARWIVERRVIRFDWQMDGWLPLFQFNLLDMTPQPRMAPVCAELNAVYSPWELATWFARPNPWLADATPVDTLMCDLPGVLNAARADRFIAHG